MYGTSPFSLFLSSCLDLENLKKKTRRPPTSPRSQVKVLSTDSESEASVLCSPHPLRPCVHLLVLLLLPRRGLGIENCGRDQPKAMRFRKCVFASNDSNDDLPNMYTYLEAQKPPRKRFPVAHTKLNGLQKQTFGHQASEESNYSPLRRKRKFTRSMLLPATLAVHRNLVARNDVRDIDTYYQPAKKCTSRMQTVSRWSSVQCMGELK